MLLKKSYLKIFGKSINYNRKLLEVFSFTGNEKWRTKKQYLESKIVTKIEAEDLGTESALI